MNNDKIEPFVKWAGGKRQLMNRLNLVLPETYNTLIEPFVGGGSFFIEQKNNSNIINDINNELMVTYEVIKRERERERVLKVIEWASKKQFTRILFKN